MRIPTTRQTFDIAGHPTALARSADGVIKIWAEDDVGLARGLGFAHAHDRLVQLMLARLVGQGRLGEHLKANSETEEIDIFMRQLGLARDADNDAANLEQPARRLGEAYAEGVNAHLARQSRPLEFLIARYRPEPWRLADTLLTIKLMSYIGLAQSQQDVEKLIVQAIRSGCDIERLGGLFAPHLDGLDDETISAIRELRYLEPLIPESIRISSSVPHMMASNNWAVSGRRTATGHPIQCNDPHLECNRLPAIWYEAIMHTKDDYRIGVTMPGVPGVIMGRTRELSFGFTYGFMDMIDFFVEECRGGACRRDSGFQPLDDRTEQIRRRGKAPLTIVIRENDLGVLESDPLNAELADGYYLTRAWSCHRGGAAASMNALASLPHVLTVAEAQTILREVTISCNWVLADRQGNIGYQQSGRLPDRQHSGIFPVPAWDDRFTWRGFVAADRLHSVLNPDDDLIVTANDEHNPPGGPLAVNLPMGSYRAERIRAMLEAENPVTMNLMRRIQNDVFSVQAATFMEMLRPHIPDTFAGRLLDGWDLRYSRDSRAATLFETVYETLVSEVVANRVFGSESWREIVGSTAVVADYYHLFDRALLGADPMWFGSEGKEAVLERVLAEVLTEVSPEAITPWGSRRKFMMTNVFFGGALPRGLGFDYGPVSLPGNRATVVQGGIFVSHGRQTTFTPSWRFMSDLGEDRASTALAGGPSGRRFSRWYTTDIDRWLAGEYKDLVPDPELS